MALLLLYFTVALHVMESFQKEETSLIFSGKEVDFTKSLLDKQHEFNDTSLEVNKIWPSFYLGRPAQQKFT